MSIYASFDNENQEQVASNTGWSQFGNWVETLDANLFDQLIVLWEHGWSQEVPTLATELAFALHSVPPQEATISATGQLLLAALKHNQEAEAVFIGDGFTKS